MKKKRMMTEVREKGNVFYSTWQSQEFEEIGKEGHQDSQDRGPTVRSPRTDLLDNRKANSGLAEVAVLPIFQRKGLAVRTHFLLMDGGHHSLFLRHVTGVG